MNYKELLLYKKARELVIGVDPLITVLPNKPQAWAVSRQLFGAATSIGANIAEGRGRHIGKEYQRFLYYAQGSANEVDHWLHVMKDCRLGPPKLVDDLILLNVEVLRLLSATLSTLRRELGQSTVREEGAGYDTEFLADELEVPLTHNP